MLVTASSDVYNVLKFVNEIAKLEQANTLPFLDAANCLKHGFASLN